MSKRLAITRGGFQNSSDSDEKENSPQMSSLKECADNMQRKRGPATSHDALIDREVAYGIRLGVTTPTVFAPVTPTLAATSSNMLVPTTPHYPEANVLACDARGLSRESIDDTGGRPESASAGTKKARWIKHTLASGLIIEVEATEFNGLLPSLMETSNQPTLHSPIQAIVETPSPESPKSESGSDCYYTHLEDWLLDPRQGSDGFYAQYMEALQAQQELPFYERTIWQKRFIPTLLRFLGTRSDPWDFSGDAFMTILPDIWLTVYHEPSWPNEDDALVRSLVSDSVVSWFESFASSALAAVEKFLKGSVDASPNFSEWSEKCEGMMRDYRASDHPGGPGCFAILSSTFVLVPLSGHLQAINGGKQIEGLACSPEGLEYPFGALGLAAAAAFRAMQLFRAQLVGYDEDGKMFIETPTGDIAEPTIMEIAFSKYTAEERTRRHSSFAYNLPRHELDDILWQAQDFVPYPDYDEINTEDEVLSHVDDEHNAA